MTLDRAAIRAQASADKFVTVEVVEPNGATWKLETKLDPDGKITRFDAPTENPH